MKKIIVFLFVVFFKVLTVNGSYVILNQDNDLVIEGSNIHEKRLIASITKVMTAYVVINNVSLDDLVTVGDEINEAHGSSIYLVKGEVLSVRDLLYGMMLRSGNDAAIVLSNYVGGSVSNFVDMMNQEVKNLKLKDTIFKNPTGLDDNQDGNISTAYDMAIITNNAMKNNIFKKIFKTKHYKCKSNLKAFDWYNKNKALSMYKHVSGGKTGYTKKAYRTLITTASKDNINLTIVTLNMGDDFNFHVNKYKKIFHEFNNYLILNKTNLEIDDKYFKKKNCSFYILNNYYYLSKRENIKNLHIEYIINDNTKPINNAVVGSAVIYNNKKPIHEEVIYLSCKERYRFL